MHAMVAPADPAPAEVVVSVSSDITWAQLLPVLRQQGLRPAVVPEDAAQRVIDSIALDSFGDASHRFGAVASCVASLTLRSASSAATVIGRGDPRFVETAGSGPSDQIESLGLRCLRRGPILSTCRCAWTSLPEFLRDMVVSAALRQHDFVRARLFWGARDYKCVVQGIVGGFAGQVDLSMLRPVRSSMTEHIDLAVSPELSSTLPGPRLGLAFPLPAGLHAWSELCVFLDEIGLVPKLATGRSAAALVSEAGWPGAHSLGREFRVELVPDPLPIDEAAAATAAGRLADQLHQVALRVQALGGRSYPTGPDSPTP